MPIKDPNILLLTDDMMPGGVERHVIHLANGLFELGISVSVAATDGPFRQFMNPAIRFISLPLLYSGTYRKRILGIPRSIALLKRFIRENNISIIHSHKRYTDFVARLLVHSSKEIRHVSTCHSIYENLKWLPSFGEFTIACSKNIEEMLVNSYNQSTESVRTIYNGVPSLPQYSNDRIIEIKNRLGLKINSSIICSIGNLIQIKNPEILLCAFRKLIFDRKMRNTYLILVGEGDQEDILKKFIQQHSLQEQVLVLPASTHVEDIFNISNFCVLSSLREGFPLVLLEAASIGKPYIATDVGGVSEFIEHNINGILVPPTNLQALTEAIAYLLENGDKVKVLGENARIKYRQYFGLEKMISETREVYQQLHNMKSVKV